MSAPSVSRRAVSHRSQSYHRSHREFGIDPFALARIRDFGDVPIPTPTLADQAALDIEKFYAWICRGVDSLHDRRRPRLHAAGAARRSASSIRFPYHSYGDSAGVHCHAGNGFRIGLEEDLIDPQRSIHVGLNGPMVHPNMDGFSRAAGYRMLTLAEIEDIGMPAAQAEIRRVIGDGPVFVTVDLDVLSLSDAPAVAGNLTFVEKNVGQHREGEAARRAIEEVDVIVFGADEAENAGGGGEKIRAVARGY